MSDVRSDLSPSRAILRGGDWLWAGSKALVTYLITLLGLVVVTFFIGRLIPTDPVLAIVGNQASVETYEQVRRELGFDKSLLEQFAVYLGDLLRGDLGVSVLTTRPVLADMVKTFPATLELASMAIVIGAALGIPLGVLAAVRHGRWVDQAIRVVSLVGFSVPTFWLGLIALLVLYARLDLLPGPGRLDVVYQYSFKPVTGLLLVDAPLQNRWDVAGNALAHLAMPSAILGYVALAYICRLTRSMMLAELSQEYVTAARVKGLSERRVIWGHAFRNVAGALITVVLLTYGMLLEGSVLLETVFAWPGLGSYMTNSLRNADMNAVIGGTLVIGAVFITLNALADLLQRRLDPRSA